MSIRYWQYCRNCGLQTVRGIKNIYIKFIKIARNNVKIKRPEGICSEKWYSCTQKTINKTNPHKIFQRVIIECYNSVKILDGKKGKI